MGRSVLRFEGCDALVSRFFRDKAGWFVADICRKLVDVKQVGVMEGFTYKPRSGHW